MNLSASVHVYLAMIILISCRTPAGSRLANEGSVPTDSSQSTSVEPATALNCQDVATKAKLSAAVTDNLCGSDDPEGKAACILAASESLKTPSSSIRIPSGPLNSMQLAKICANSSAAIIGACIREARLASLSSYDISSLCEKGSPDITACIVAANEALTKDPASNTTPAEALGSMTIAAICATANADTASCITSTRKAGMSSGSSYQACKAGAGGNHSASCIEAATRPLAKPTGSSVNPTGPLGSVTTTSLCGAKASEGSAPCITAARLAGFNESNVYSLCKSGAPNSALCIDAALRPLQASNSEGFTPSPVLSSFNVLGVCGAGNTNSASCIEAARQSGMATPSITSMCHKATAATAACINAARPTRSKALSEIYTTTLCTKASGETVECINKGRSEGKSLTAIASQCEPNS